jgi:hypothetical protein
MANNRNDFEPGVRNSAWWSGDSRMAANGRAVDAILDQARKEAPDLSDVEAVQMGHVMQPVIGRLFQDKHKIELKEADYALTHPKHDWMRSHFDFISADGTCLLKLKTITLEFAIAMMPMLIGFLMLTLPSSYTNLLVIISIVYFWLFYLVEANS